MSYYLRTVPLLMSALLLVHAHTLRANELANSFLDSVVFTNVGYTGGASVITNFPLRVDLSTTRPNGFDYDLAGVNAAELRFNYHENYVDAGTDAVVDVTAHFAITNWNPEGTSTLYVNVPRFSNSKDAKLTMYWNPVAHAEIPPNYPTMVPAAVSDPAQDARWNQAIADQAANENYLGCDLAHRKVLNGVVYEDRLLNYWLTAPSISKTSWKQGDELATIDIGVPVSTDPVTTIEYFDRSNNSSLGDEMPQVPGSYRAVVTVADDGVYSPISESLDFAIESGAPLNGIATTNDFAYRVEFKLDPTKLTDTSLTPHFYANDTSVSQARAAYNYKTEVEASGAVTIGVWFKYDTTAATTTDTRADKVCLIGLCAGDAQPRGPLGIFVDNYGTRTKNKIYVRGNAGTDATHTPGPYSADFAKTTSVVWGDGEWHFVMASRTSGGIVQLFVDGEYQAVDISELSTVYDKSVLYSYNSNYPNNFSVGVDPANNGKGSSFNGWFAEAQVYDKALTEEEMRYIYTSKRRLNGIEDGLIGYFPMNDLTAVGTGTTIADKNQNSTTLHNITAAGLLKWEEPSPALPFTGGLSILNDKPFLVLLKDNYPSGFTYDSLVFGQTEESFYSDVRFYDQNGESLDYQIDLWDPLGQSSDGYTRIWVDVKNYTEATRIIMCWGQGAYTELPENDPDSVCDAFKTTQEKYKHRQYYIAGYGSSLVLSGTATYDEGMRLQNRWITPPSLSTTQWKPGESAPVVVKGTSYSGAASVRYIDRSTGKELSSLPVSQVGEYRAIFEVEETEEWSSLSAEINFRIVDETNSHDLGNANARVLLANNDSSVAGGEIYAQSYDDNEDGWGVPFWTHHNKGSSEDVSDFDATKLFADFNLFPGTCHEYMETSGSTTNRLWGLVNVRFGNLFNNGRYHPGETGSTGLKPDQNYLPWNPVSERMLSYEGMTVGEYHRYAGTFLMQNVLNNGHNENDYAQICSPCYDEGIGTIYFDIVNAFTNNVRDADGNANYAIVVEVATNIVDDVGGATDLPPVDGPWPYGIWSSSADGSVIYDAYRYADWQAVSMTPIRFRDNTGVDTVDCEMLPATTELELDITDGGTAKNFYRVCVPLNISCPARFRIRRTRIDDSASLNPDANAFIIVDNVICSKSRELLQLQPYGWFDPQKNGKQYLGQEAAFTPPFPGPKDAVTARVKVVDAKGNPVEAGKVSAVTMHYRWRYLEQRNTGWSYVDFNPSTYTALEPLILPGLPGDVEFWFEGSQNSGYYTYANYSGTKLGVPGYSESSAIITNGWDGTSASWNIRIREGSCEYEGAVAVIREPNRDDFEIPMELLGNHQWRAYYQVTNAIADGAKVRFELRNKQESGATEWSWNTNRLYCADKGADITPPYNGKLVDGGVDDWTHIPVDKSTGYIMFQVDDSSKGVSVVRADYQNFNLWSDGYGSVFVGSSADDSTLPSGGTSPLTREFTAYYNNLTSQISVPTNDDWSLDFEYGKSYNYYKTFSAGSEIVNAWKLGKGRYVYGNYYMPASGTAHQMVGGGEGYVEFYDNARNLWPRGVEKVTFSARLAQSIGFDDFSYYDTGAAHPISNYVFMAHVAFDHDSNQSFTGNASLSMIANYRRGKGCYEARWEQVGGVTDTYGTVIGPMTKPANNVASHRLSLYRWNRNSSGGYDATLLASFDNDNNKGLNITMPDTDADLSLDKANMLPMSLAAYSYGTAGDVMLVVGFCTSTTTAGGTYDKSKWQYAGYLDNSAQKLTSGTYGVLTANSPGIFAYPRISMLKTSNPNWGSFSSNLPKAGSSSRYKGNTTYPLESKDFTSCRSDIVNECWTSVPGRAEPFVESDIYGFRAADSWQTINLWASSTTGTESYSELLASFTLSNHWGRINVKEEFGADIPLVWRTSDAKLRLQTGGDLDEVNAKNVIIDNIRVHQWRGKNEIVLYDSGNSADSTSECKPTSNGLPGSFIYTGGWINGKSDGTTAIEFSAKRTIPGRPAGIRTPFMDGVNGRGSGIGSLCFSYQNAQTNVALLVQIVTNRYLSTLVSDTKYVDDDGPWVTCCRLTYADLGESGVTNISFAARVSQTGCGCMARVIVDPDLVESVANVTDTTAFGSIEITYASCQDEPPIDKGCWWGWNIRTLGDSGDSEKRMYLPDASMRPNPGRSLALNNSVTEDIVESKALEYRRHMPFLQSPTFGSNVIGQVSFRARKYGYNDSDQAAEVAIYGTTAAKIAIGGSDEWTLLARFAISNTVFTSYSYRADMKAGYAAIRLAVTGVKNVDPAERGPSPQYGNEPVRVLLDEVVVSEAVNPELAFRGVGAFRSNISGTEAIDNVPSKSEQPLAKEAWGVQCELFAVMLEDEIDMTDPPRVKLYWYEGDEKKYWGFENWKDHPDHHEAWLGRASGTDSLIYRSSYENAPDSVIPMSEKDPGGYPPVVQYMLEAYYTVVDPDTGAKTEVTKLLDIAEGEWTVPDWYAPVDYNADENHGEGKNLSCFCILDDIASGWVWINEVNIFSFNDWDNDDENCQFIEVAAPQEYDLSGWRIEVLERYGSNATRTNTLAVFGTNLEGTKTAHMTSNYVFHVIANPEQQSGERTIFNEDGTLDGIWDYPSTYGLISRAGVIDWGESFGIRLVRPNGIVEHEIVTVGTNLYTSALNKKYTPDGVVEFFNQVTEPGKFFHPGQDSNTGDHSVGVVNSQGEGPICWNNTMHRTPGKINDDQQINPDYPVPQGEMMGLSLTLDQTGGNIWHSFDGGVTFTNAVKKIYLKNGSILGTNIIYKVEPWYEVAYVSQTSDGTTTYFDVSNGFDRVNRTVEVNVGRLCNGKVTIVAKATPDHQLKELGCDEKNIYTPAVIDWLQTGCTLDGEPFANDDGIIRLAEFWGLIHGPWDPTNYLSLTEMYWLDMDPTVGELVLQAGMVAPPAEVLTPVYDGDYDAPSYVTNLTMSVFMMISNRTDGTNWSPYVLRGVEPGSSSIDYVAGSTTAWTSETFKISGILPNGHTSESVRENWVDLRWFVFHPDSFYQPEDEPAHKRYTTDIEISDPVNSLDSPGYGAGWYDWVHDPDHPEHASVRPFFRWGLDTRLRPFEVEILQTNNYLKATTP